MYRIPCFIAKHRDNFVANLPQDSEYYINTCTQAHGTNEKEESAYIMMIIILYKIMTSYTSMHNPTDTGYKL
jgi:hypothetical protein